MAKKAANTKVVEKKEKATKTAKQLKKEKKAKKDKNAPKRAISAFFFYQKNRRESLKVEQKELTNKQLISKMSDEWKNLTEEQRVPYQKMAEGDKLRYEKDKKEYEKTKGTAAAPKSATKVPAGKKSATKKSDDE